MEKYNNMNEILTNTPQNDKPMRNTLECQRTLSFNYYHAHKNPERFKERNNLQK